MKTGIVIKLAMLLCAFMMMGATVAIAQTDLAWQFDATVRPTLIDDPPASDYSVGYALTFPYWVEMCYNGGIHRQGLVILLRSTNPEE